jgi:DNA polymerase III subunit delta
MIVKAGDVERSLAKPPSGLIAALVFGPDAGLVHERAERLARTAVADLADPFRVCDLEESALTSDPARLADEAASISMLGGRRVVRVRGGNALAKIFEAFLDAPKGDALVVVEAGDLAKSAALRALFEDKDRENVIAIACYPDTQRDLSDIVRSALKDEGLAISAEALEDSVSRLGSDRGVTRRELEKLALYARGQKSVSLEDVRAVLGDEAEVRVEQVCDAAGEGDLPRLDLALERLWSSDTNPSQILRAAMGHFQRLLQVKLAHERGESVDAAMKRGWPQIHFSRTTSFKAQVARWSEARLLDAGDLLLETEALTRTTGVPAEAATARALFNVAAMAKKRSE